MTRAEHTPPPTPNNQNSPENGNHPNPDGGGARAGPGQHQGAGRDHPSRGNGAGRRAGKGGGSQRREGPNQPPEATPRLVGPPPRSPQHFRFSLTDYDLRSNATDVAMALRCTATAVAASILVVTLDPRRRGFCTATEVAASEGRSGPRDPREKGVLHSHRGGCVNQPRRP